jgi:hypothetical protein
MKSKILLLLTLVVFGGCASNAQTIPGKYFIGGNFNGYSTKNTESSLGSKIQSYNINLQLGKIVKANTVIGVIVSIGYYKTHIIDFPDSNLSKNNQFSAGVFYRKYKRLLKDFYLFAEADAEYNHIGNSQVYYINGNGLKSTSDGGSLSFLPGISYSICKRMQLELLMVNLINLTYYHEKTEYPNSIPFRHTDSGNSISFNANLNSNLLSNFGVGFKFLLGK